MGLLFLIVLILLLVVGLPTWSHSRIWAIGRAAALACSCIPSQRDLLHGRNPYFTLLNRAKIGRPNWDVRRQELLQTVEPKVKP
jgi:hypothetical protein